MGKCTNFLYSSSSTRLTRFHSDQGDNFDSNIIKQLSSIYHPQGNGIYYRKHERSSSRIEGNFGKRTERGMEEVFKFTTVRLRLCACDCAPATVRLRVRAYECALTSARIRVRAYHCAPTTIRLQLYATRNNKPLSIRVNVSTLMFRRKSKLPIDTVVGRSKQKLYKGVCR